MMNLNSTTLRYARSAFAVTTCFLIIFGMAYCNQLIMRFLFICIPFMYNVWFKSFDYFYKWQCIVNTSWETAKIWKSRSNLVWGGFAEFFIFFVSDDFFYQYIYYILIFYPKYRDTVNLITYGRPYNGG